MTVITFASELKEKGQPSKSVGNDHEKENENARENGKENGMEHGRENGRENGKESGKENGKENGKEKDIEETKENSADRHKEDGNGKENGEGTGKRDNKDGHESGVEKGEHENGTIHARNGIDPEDAKDNTTTPTEVETKQPEITNSDPQELGQESQSKQITTYIDQPNEGEKETQHSTEEANVRASTLPPGDTAALPKPDTDSTHSQDDTKKHPVRELSAKALTPKEFVPREIVVGNEQPNQVVKKALPSNALVTQITDPPAAAFAPKFVPAPTTNGHTQTKLQTESGSKLLRSPAQQALAALQVPNEPFTFSKDMTFKTKLSTSAPSALAISLTERSHMAKNVKASKVYPLSSLLF
jgi:hypothetical protein